jgi:hypothetical protein
LRTAILDVCKVAFASGWNEFVEGLWSEEIAFKFHLCFEMCGVSQEAKCANAIDEQEEFMFSGLERERAVFRRQQSVAWAWIKARGVLSSRVTPAHSKAATSVLLKSACGDGEDASNWRESLAAITYRSLARQLCDQFYDLSIFQAWQNRGHQGPAVSRMIVPALPSYCRDEAASQVRGGHAQKSEKARILTDVLTAQPETRSGVLIYLRSRAA